MTREHIVSVLEYFEAQRRPKPAKYAQDVIDDCNVLADAYDAAGLHSDADRIRRFLAVIVTERKAGGLAVSLFGEEMDRVHEAFAAHDPRVRS